MDEVHRRGAWETRPEVIVATSMVGECRSLLPRGWRDLPIVLYMHENQAAYPFRQTRRVEVERDHHYAMTNLQSILAADLVVWNSTWNLDSFCRAIEILLARSSDGVLQGVERRIRDRSTVIWPPVARPPVLHNSRSDGFPDPAKTRERPVRILWPHRWEHDKGPETLFRLARWLRARSPGRYRWTILGERFQRIPEAMSAFLDDFQADLDHVGWVPERAEYWAHLGRCDWVLSTARHEFFGLAVVEAMLAGCLPWLPNRLSYPEITPKVARGLHPGNHPKDPGALRRAIRDHLEATTPQHAARAMDDAVDHLIGGSSTPQAPPASGSPIMDIT